MPQRIDRDELFMSACGLWASRSTCVRGQTAAVIVRENRIISVGYNGAPPHLPHCTEVGCSSVYSDTVVGIPNSGPETLRHENSLTEFGCQRAIHAELNAIAWAARAGISTEGTTMYMLSQPCLRCAQAIISAGIEEVVWRNQYRAARLDLLDDAFIKIRRA